MTDTATRRINMRISEENLDLIREAAAANGQDLTSFVLGSALASARQVVADQHVTRLSAEAWQEFQAWLEAEPEENPGLERLLRLADENAEDTGIPIGIDPRSPSGRAWWAHAFPDGLPSPYNTSTE